MKTLTRAFCVLSILMLLWLWGAVACVTEPEPKQQLPEWLTLQYRQKTNFKEHIEPSD